ncbi:C39 family peptidase [Patescibacteria group bacterium]|nr:C39 family peptidase [Patescibacteria group bacterium]
MSKYLLIILLLLMLACPQTTQATSLLVSHSGSIFLQVEKNGEAWYLSPKDQALHYLGRPADAFRIMREQALGVTHDIISRTSVFPDNLLGRILLDVEKNGEAYYIYPQDRHKYYLGRPADAFRIMRELGLGISNNNLTKLELEIKNYIKSPSLNNNQIIISGVPFTAQAPLANWSDPRQQNGCEEASAIMAMYWVKNKALTKAQAESEIVALSNWLDEKYGIAVDTSTQDTLDWIFKDYFQYNQVERFTDVSQQQIIDELTKGNLVVAAFDGRKLNNPNFVAPGPSTHMLVILGYDPINNQFITNDPGTRHGENYRYSSQNLYEAIRDYPTGNHKEINIFEKNMIVIKK